MRNPPPADIECERWPRLWRLFLIGTCTLVLCSCSGPQQQQLHNPPVPNSHAFSSLPPQAYAGIPAPREANALGGPWSPPGISQPWPEDEYLRDGGDRDAIATVGSDWEIHGLELEDTIAHYDLIDGQTVVQPSNRVHIYSPRFGAVRHVVEPAAHAQSHQTSGVHLPRALAGPRTVEFAATSTQNEQTERQVVTQPLEIYRSRQGDGVVSSKIGLNSFQDAFKAYENLQLIRIGRMDASEMAWLARGSTAAVAWQHKQAVQIILDHQAAMAELSVDAVQSAFTYKAPPPGAAKLRVVKVASLRFAEPGDEVEFTIRFDNVGAQEIGNVTIVDNLSTRLEYVADSAQCNLDAEFFTQPNAGDSLAVRCEVADPLPPGQGGILRFRCRVR